MAFVCLFIGVILGLLCGKVLFYCKTAGTLMFYDVEPGEPPVMTAELECPVDDIRSLKSVIFKVSRR